MKLTEEQGKSTEEAGGVLGDTSKGVWMVEEGEALYQPPRWERDL